MPENAVARAALKPDTPAAARTLASRCMSPRRAIPSMLTPPPGRTPSENFPAMAGPPIADVVRRWRV